MVKVTVERGSFDLQHKTDFSGPSYKINILAAKYMKNHPHSQPLAPGKSNVTGFSKEKKDRLLSNLAGIIPESRLKFWKQLPEL